MTREEHCKLLEDNGWKIISKEPFDIEKYEDGKLVAKAFGQAAFTIAFHLEKDHRLPGEITLEELANEEKHAHGLTVGTLKKILGENNLPDDGKVLVERVHDFYFERNGWDVVFKKGDYCSGVERMNKEMQAEIERRKKGEEPEYDMEDPQKYIFDLTKDMMSQYHPAWCAGKFGDDDKNLYICLHY